MHPGATRFETRSDDAPHLPGNSFIQAGALHMSSTIKKSAGVEQGTYDGLIGRPIDCCVALIMTPFDSSDSDCPLARHGRPRRRPAGPDGHEAHLPLPRGPQGGQGHPWRQGRELVRGGCVYVSCVRVGSAYVCCVPSRFYTIRCWTNGGHGSGGSYLKWAGKSRKNKLVLSLWGFDLRERPVDSGVWSGRAGPKPQLINPIRPRPHPKINTNR